MGRLPGGSKTDGWLEFWQNQEGGLDWVQWCTWCTSLKRFEPSQGSLWRACAEDTDDGSRGERGSGAVGRRPAKPLRQPRGIARTSSGANSEPFKVWKKAGMIRSLIWKTTHGNLSYVLKIHMPQRKSCKKSLIREITLSLCHSCPECPYPCSVLKASDWKQAPCSPSHCLQLFLPYGLLMSCVVSHLSARQRAATSWAKPGMSPEGSPASPGAVEERAFVFLQMHLTIKSKRINFYMDK